MIKPKAIVFMRDAFFKHFITCRFQVRLQILFWQVGSNCGFYRPNVLVTGRDLKFRHAGLWSRVPNTFTYGHSKHLQGLLSDLKENLL